MKPFLFFLSVIILSSCSQDRLKGQWEGTTKFKNCGSSESNNIVFVLKIHKTESGSYFGFGKLDHKRNGETFSQGLTIKSIVVDMPLIKFELIKDNSEVVKYKFEGAIEENKLTGKMYSWTCESWNFNQTSDIIIIKVN